MNLTVNGEPRAIDDIATVQDLLHALGVAPERVAVEVNLDVVPRARLAQHPLHEGDRVEIVSFVGGG
jgi:thiamine biosynthesis protein ThiS